MMESRIPPQAEQSEQAVLGAIFLEESVIKTIVDKLDVNDFYALRNRIIFEAMVEMFETNIRIDYRTLTEHLSTRDLLASAGGEDYIFQLSDTTPSVANIDYYIDIVKDKSIIRQMIETSKQIAEEGYKATDMASFIDDAEKRIFDVASSRRTSGFVKIGTITEDVIAKTEAAKLAEGHLTGLDTGFELINQYTLGLQPKNSPSLPGVRPWGNRPLR